MRLSTSHIAVGASQARETPATFVHAEPGSDAEQAWSTEPVPVHQRVGEVSRGSGPALITENHTTTIVPPDWTWQRLGDGTLFLEAVTTNV